MFFFKNNIFYFYSVDLKSLLLIFFSGNCIFPGADPSSAAGGTLRLHHEEQEELSVAQLDRVRKFFFIFYFLKMRQVKKQGNFSKKIIIVTSDRLIRA